MKSTDETAPASPFIRFRRRVMVRPEGSGSTSPHAGTITRRAITPRSKQKRGAGRSRTHSTPSQVKIMPSFLLCLFCLLLLAVWRQPRACGRLLDHAVTSLADQTQVRPSSPRSFIAPSPSSRPRRSPRSPPAPRGALRREGVVACSAPRSDSESFIVRSSGVFTPLTPQQFYC